MSHVLSPHKVAMSEEEKESQATLTQTAMMLRNDLCSETFIAGDAKVQEVIVAASELEKVDNYQMDRKVQLRAFAVSSFGEAQTCP